MMFVARGCCCCAVVLFFDPKVRVKFVMDGDKMRLDLDNVEGRELSSAREAPPQQPPAWTIK